MHDQVVNISKHIVPRSLATVSIDDLDDDARALFEEACALAQRLREKHRGDRQRWSEEGTIAAVLIVYGARDARLKPAMENHAYAHRHFPDQPCTPECLAHDLWAVLDRGVQVVKPASDWPIREILKEVVEHATGYEIENYHPFADQVRRHLKQLQVALRTPGPRRTKSQRELIRMYNVTISLDDGPQNPAINQKNQKDCSRPQHPKM